MKKFLISILLSFLSSSIIAENDVLQKNIEAISQQGYTLTSITPIWPLVVLCGT